DVYPEHRLWLVEVGSAPVVAALRTPPHGLVLARPSADGALEVLAAAIDDELPGVVGAVPEAGAFAAAWSARTGRDARMRTRQGIYALERVNPPSGVSGGARAADSADRDLVVAWWREFAIEALHGAELDMDRIEASGDPRL